MRSANICLVDRRVMSGESQLLTQLDHEVLDVVQPAEDIFHGPTSTRDTGEDMPQKHLLASSLLRLCLPFEGIRSTPLPDCCSTY